ncbi:MAG: anaerobic ribonucleoside-triphosphate reductase activating protein [Microbacteriaceae bacterium]|nr:anaerobic ribonucleoside-triphosphate reductase activating protein [Microbacteriaceae bacterium]
MSPPTPAPSRLGPAPTRPSPSKPLARADDLAIAGLVPFGTVDWPGRLAATVFCQGCPWACGYCHNHELICSRTPGRVPWQEVRELLAARRGLLDGIVFSGGEALRQPAVLDAMREARDAGFGVALHTAGAFPNRLRDALHLVDWVGLDIKALPEHYAEVVGRPGARGQAWRALEMLLASEVDFEVRTTVAPGRTAADALEAARRCRALGVRAFALQRARGTGTRPGFAATADGWEAQCDALARRIEELGFERFDYRTG